MGASAHVFGRLLLLCLVALALGFAVPVAGVSSAAARQSQTQLQRTLRGRFLHITDFHPDELYKIHSSSAQGKACHRGHGTAGVYGAEKTDCDSPFALADQSLNWIAENLKHDIDFVVWTGDSARHDSDDKHPRSELGILDSNRDMVDKFIHTFSDGDGKLSVPIIPTFGNNDFLPHNIMNAGPSRWFRAYSDIWRHFIPEVQRPSFLHGGWFYIEVIPEKLAVLSLNTMFFFERNAAVDGCADPSEPGYEHMEWLRIQLQSMRDRGMKALLMGHVPPARTDNKQLWDETCWQKYTLWLHQYRDVVTGSLYGHMNIDHFMLQDTQQLDLGQESDGLHIRELDFASEDEGDDDDGMYDDGDGDDKKLHTQSKGDYLLDLREEWSDLPDSIMETLQDRDSVYEQAARVERLQKPLMRQEKTKKRKGKKDKNDEDIGGEHAERYHVSLVSPSVVPNYFPTLRVFDYNISGLEEAPVWEDGFDELKSFSWDLTQARKNDEDRHFELRRRDAVIAMAVKEQKKQEGAQQAGQGKLLVPESPTKELLPGPAHYPQPLTLTGYVQYYANLTYINEVSASKRRGGRSDETPRHSPPQPRKFKYEVEYSTFDDELYRLRDLTVKRFVHLAYRMGHKRQNEARAGAAESEDGSRDGKERGEDREAVMKKRRKGKKRQRKRKKRKGESNKTWLHFLNHAFVKTVPAEELEKL